MTEPPEATQSELLLPNGVRIRGPISTIVHNYRFFYFLANELAYLARQAAEQYKSDPEKHTPLNEYRYSIASVIFSFTFVEGYINHLMYSPDSHGTR